MRKSRAVIAVPKKKTVSFAVAGREGHNNHHFRTPFGEVTNKKNGSALTRRCDDDDDGKCDDDEEPDSPMTVRRKWNKEHGLCDENKKKTSTMKHSFASPSNNNNARFKATAMDKVLILQRRVESLEVRV
jgi:CRISPR/Cas system-associated protein Cas7 (RAMP superfamily)